MTGRTAGRISAALLVLTAILFIVGVRSEPAEASETRTIRTESAHESTEDPHEESSERESSGRESSEHGEATERRELIGVDLESTWLAIVAVAASLALAAAMWPVGDRRVAIVTLGFAAVFAALDVAEVAHQLDESRNGLAALAITIAVGHALATATAGRTVWKPT